MRHLHFFLRRRFARILLAMVVVLVLVPAQAGVRKVKPGKDIRLEPNEGLLLVAIDTNTELQFLRIKRDGAVFDGGTIAQIPKGRTSQLYVVPAGRYRWDSVREYSMRYTLGDDEEYAFDVKPGIVNYPGDLIYRPTSLYSAMVHVANRGLQAMDWLEETHPQISRQQALEYIGHYPDPFPALYREQRAKAGKTEERTTPLPASGPLALSVEELWRPSSLDIVDINHAGDLVALVTKEKKGDDWSWLVDVVDLGKSTRTRVLDSPKEIGRVDWSGDRALLVSVGESHEPDILFILRIEDDTAGNRKYVRLHVPREGLLVDALPNDPDHILFATQFERAGRWETQVHRLDITSQKALSDFNFRTRDALDKGVANDRAWYADGAGRLRAALASRDDTMVLMHGADGHFREVMTFEDTESFTPMALSADGNTIYGWTEKDREQRELVEFDPATAKVGRTLFSRSGADVQGPLFDPKRRLIGATYFEDGQIVSHYFDKESEVLYRRLQKAFPGKTVSILDRDGAARQFLLLVGGSDQPSLVYHFDATANRASLLESTRPWLEKRTFAPAQVIRTKSKDGLDIEAYLTMPKDAKGNVPLVVFPHGGPIGVRDSRYFDPEVQFVASLGYAVLQVNFRGSEGYGKSFREAGKRNYGTLIEDDVDAALAATLAAFPLDGDRMCGMGASYGGYSALVSAIRWPGRFRCVVSISGISDKILAFTASDTGRSKEGRKTLEEFIGDPRTQLDSMREYSPLYRHSALDMPILLAHGTEDLRADYEHTRRLQRMLNLDRRPPSVITMEGEGHGVDDPANRQKLWEGIAGFLRANLEAGAKPAAAAATAAP